MAAFDLLDKKLSTHCHRILPSLWLSIEFGELVREMLAQGNTYVNRENLLREGRG
jgi:hypothetical protein